MDDNGVQDRRRRRGAGNPGDGGEAPGSNLRGRRRGARAWLSVGLSKITRHACILFLPPFPHLLTSRPLWRDAGENILGICRPGAGGHVADVTACKVPTRLVLARVVTARDAPALLAQRISIAIWPAGALVSIGRPMAVVGVRHQAASFSSRCAAPCHPRVRARADAVPG